MRAYLGLFTAVVALASIAVFSVARIQPTGAASTSPASGWTIHIDALKHFKNHPDEVAHHWCRSIGGDSLQCQIYASDDPNAPMVATELIVPTATWKAFPASEQQYWHYHRTEIPKVSAKMPDVSADEAKAMVAKLQETYGKVYVIWDPMDSKEPVGTPSISILQPR